MLKYFTLNTWQFWPIIRTNLKFFTICILTNSILTNWCRSLHDQGIRWCTNKQILSLREQRKFLWFFPFFYYFKCCFPTMPPSGVNPPLCSYAKLDFFYIHKRLFPTDSSPHNLLNKIEELMFYSSFVRL